ncbi:MAG TPA: transposase [Syntrophales bacterium]|nr:transposase [Syntrophales bacterium]HOX95304.1 transposase [Syntrophales bacterium]HPI57843.1 transposase [Syntrophales bacterium]HPN24501.1 transposase [Syntrophales bacterium]HQM28807.1 transposase [Syntrophales bacterium]
MARKPRIHFHGAFYHVIVRGNGGQDIFWKDEDRQLYLRFLKDYKERHPFNLYAYALMKNHAHLLMEVGDVPLARIMQVVQFRYAKRFNYLHGKEGHLFQGRYKAILCDKDKYFLELSAYIHLNPVRGGLVKDPLEYPWTSYRVYMGSKQENLVDEEFLLRIFDDRKNRARKAYDRFVRSRIEDEKADDFYKIQDQRFLGDEEFIKGARQAFKGRKHYRDEISIDRLIAVVACILKIDRILFYSATRNRDGALGRAVVGYLGRKIFGYANSVIASQFRKDPATLSCGVRRVEERLMREISFAKLIEKLEDALVQDRDKYQIIKA